MARTAPRLLLRGVGRGEVAVGDELDEVVADVLAAHEGSVDEGSNEEGGVGSGIAGRGQAPVGDGAAQDLNDR